MTDIVINPNECHMKTLSLSEAKSNLISLEDSVYPQDEEVMTTKKPLSHCLYNQP